MAGLFSRIADLVISKPKPSTPPPAAYRFGSRSQQRTVAGFSVIPKKGHILPNSGKLPVRASPPFITQLSEWDVSSVLAALDQHMLGYFERSGLLWQWMARDDRMQTVLRVRRAGLTTLPFSMLPAFIENPSSKEVAYAKAIEEEWVRCVPESVIRSMVDRAVGMGVAVVKVHWYTGKYGWWWPKLTVWPHEAVRWDDVNRCYLARTRIGGECRVTPGKDWIVWEPEGPRSFQLAAVLCLALPCLITNFDWRDWVNYNEAFGRPVRKAIVPRGATTSEKNTFLANLRALGRTTSSILCARNQDDSGFDFEFVTPQGDVTATFEKSIERSDKAKATVILGQTLVTDPSSTVGMAPGDVRQNVKGQTIEGDAESLSTCLRSQLLERQALFNVGDPSLAPWPKWETAPPADKGKDAANDKAVAEAALKIDEALQGTDKQLDKIAFFEEAGIKMLDRPPSQVPAASNALNLFQSEGLLGALGLALENSEYEVDLETVLTQYGVPYKKKSPKALQAPALPVPENVGQLPA